MTVRENRARFDNPSLTLGLAATIPLTRDGEGIAADQRAMLALALSYFTWRTLVAEARLEPAAAVEAMIRTVKG